MSAASSGGIPRHAQIVDGTGKYLIPGLWDMHVHTVNHAIDFPLEIAHGVTGVRDMGGISRPGVPPGNLGVHFDSLRAWRERIIRGQMLGPRIVAAGVLVDGPVPLRDLNYSVQSAADGRRVVDSLRAAGVDFIKVYQRVPRDILVAIADHARRLGMITAGHLSDFVPVEEAARHQRSIEHVEFYEIVFDTAVWNELTRPRPNPPTESERVDFLRRLNATFDARRLVPLADAMRRHGVWNTPTVVFFPGSFRPPDTSAAARALMQYVPPHVQREWEQGAAGRFVSAEATRLRGEAVTHAIEKLRVLHTNGVPILAGSDAWNRGVVPGVSLHRELEWLTRAGLPPLEALQAATLEPARYFAATDSMGTVAPGRVADLVILEANPLEDIRNTQRITAVVVRGELLDRSRLDSLLRDARAAAGTLRFH